MLSTKKELCTTDLWISHCTTHISHGARIPYTTHLVSANWSNVSSRFHLFFHISNLIGQTPQPSYSLFPHNLVRPPLFFPDCFNKNSCAFTSSGLYPLRSTKKSTSDCQASEELLCCETSIR